MSDSVHYKVIIVGSGPAGLSAAVSAAQMGLSHLVLEAGAEIANTLQNYSDGKWVMAEPYALPVHDTIPFQAGSREEVLEHWQEAVEQSGVNIRFNSRVIELSGEKGNYAITATEGLRFTADHVVLAIGMQGNPNLLPCPGADVEGVFYQKLDDYRVRGQRIAVVGAGDSAIENAIMLSEHNEVFLLNRGEGFPKAKAANRSALIKAAQAKKLVCLFNTSISEVVESEGDKLQLRLLQNGRKAVLFADKVLAQLGTKPQRTLLEKLGLTFKSQAANAAPILNEYGESAKEGLYVVGNLTGQPLIKKAINQGYACIESICGREVIPLEYPLIQRRLMAAGLRKEPGSLVGLLKQQPSFKYASKQALIQLLVACDYEQYQAGDTLLAQSDYSDYLSVILDGKVAIYGDAGHLEYLQQGEFLGELPLLSHNPSTYNAIAESHTAVIKIPYGALKRLMDAEIELRDSIYRVYARRWISWMIAPNAPRSLLSVLLKHVQVQEWQAGDMLAVEAQQPNSVQLVLEGAVAAYDDDKPLMVYNSGDAVGLFEAIDEQPFSDDMKVIQAATLLALPVDTLRVLADVVPMFRINAQYTYRSSQQSQTFAGAGDNLIPVTLLESEQLTNATNVLAIDKHRCVDCNQCEKACAAAHDGISHLDRKAGVMIENLHLPASCRHCKTAACLSDCPADAIKRNKDGDIQISSQCIGCGNCVGNCPYNVIQLSPEKSTKGLLSNIVKLFKAEAVDNGQAVKASKCDLCHNSSRGPACVQACPTGAAQRVAPKELIELVAAD
jgi:thioredoxin reductase/Fe-S-cluster-containing hydrogenase component 2/CRP-like cAMP-binding protein